MKYLDYPVLSQLSDVLSSNPAPESRVNARVEAYSIKPVAKERKMFREMEEAYVSGQEEMEEMSFSPEMKEAGLSSCFGRLDVKESRKVHFLLVSTLNSAFDGYDFSALRPDHFTREISVPQVLTHLSSNLLSIDAVDLSPISTVQPGSLPNNSGSSPTIPQAALGGPLSSSPTSADVGNPSLYRILNDVVPLQECEVYSWFPEPEYDPHVDPEENEEASEYEDDGEDEGMEDDSMDMDIDIDGEGPYTSWGQAGIDLEMDGVPSSPGVRSRASFSSSSSRMDDFDLAMASPRLGAVDEYSSGRRVGGLLWSANYFFYSKRQKRVLFITTWCRKRPSHESATPVDQTDTGSLPLPVSSSFTPPTSTFHGFTTLGGKAARPPRVNHHNISNARPNHRRSKLTSKLTSGKSLTSSTIPIRGLATSGPVTASRLASSAPASTFSQLASPASMARMSGSGVRPRQTTARMLINAAAASQRPGGIGASRPQSVAAEDPSRVRKERSGSLTPGPSHAFGIVDTVVGSNVVGDASKGKRVKV